MLSDGARLQFVRIVAKMVLNSLHKDAERGAYIPSTLSMHNNIDAQPDSGKSKVGNTKENRKKTELKTLYWSRKNDQDA